MPEIGEAEWRDANIVFWGNATSFFFWCSGNWKLCSCTFLHGNFNPLHGTMQNKNVSGWRKQYRFYSYPRVIVYVRTLTVILCLIILGVIL